MSSTVSVLKIGGSVLQNDRSYADAARFLQRRLTLNQDERLVVIVSAQHGTTDALLAEARTIANEPSQTALDLLWSTGELRSVALLALHLQKIGVSAMPFNVHQTGLVASHEQGRGADRATGTSVRPLRLRAALVAAAKIELHIVVRSMDADAPVTHVYGNERTAHHGIRDEDDSRGTAVGA